MCRKVPGGTPKPPGPLGSQPGSLGIGELLAMDWFKGKFTGKPHRENGKIDGFRFRFYLKSIH